MCDIKTDIHLSYDGDVWAYGTVTVENLIKFTVQVRKYIDEETGEEKSFVSYPRRQSGGEWVSVVSPDAELREEIYAVVCDAIKTEMTKDFFLPDVEVLSVNFVTASPARGMKAYICAIATIKICGLTISGITVKQGEKGLFINMPQYKKNEDGSYKDMIYPTSSALRNKIQEAVLESYAAEKERRAVQNEQRGKTEQA